MRLSPRLLALCVLFFLQSPPAEAGLAACWRGFWNLLPWSQNAGKPLPPETPPQSKTRLEFEGARVKNNADELLDAAKAHLKAHGIGGSAIEYEDGAKGVEIDRKADGAAVNRYAKWVKDTLGLDVVYSPAVLQKEGVEAMVDPKRKVLYLSHDAISKLRADGAVLHELLHAINLQKLRAGVDYPFYGLVHAVNRGRSLHENARLYPEGISMDEIATYAMELDYHARELRDELNRAGRARPAEVARLTEQVRFRAGAGKRVTQEAAEIVKRSLDGMNAGDAATTLNYTGAAPGEVGRTKTPIVWVRIRVAEEKRNGQHSNFEMVVPLFGTEAAEAQKKYGLARDKTSLEAATAKAVLNRLVRARLEKMRDTAATLDTQYARVLASEPAQLVENATEPRKVTR